MTDQLAPAIRGLLVAVQSKADYASIRARCDAVRSLLVTDAGSPLHDLPLRAAELEAKLTYPGPHWFNTSRALAVEALKAALTEATPRNRRCRNADRDKWVAGQREKNTPWDEVYDEAKRLAAKRGWDIPSEWKHLAQAYYRFMGKQRKLQESKSRSRAAS